MGNMIREAAEFNQNGTVLSIEVPIKPKMSASGKNVVIATTGGNRPTDLVFKGLNGQKSGLKAPQFSIEKDVLHIDMPVSAPKASASGKNRVIASTHGNQATNLEYDGRQVYVGVNAFCGLEDNDVRLGVNAYIAAEDAE